MAITVELLRRWTMDLDTLAKRFSLRDPWRHLGILVGILLGGAVLVGCNAAPKPVQKQSSAPLIDHEGREYASNFKRIMLKSVGDIKAIKARPLPTFQPDTPKAQKRDALARQREDAIVAVSDKAYKELVTLNPPPRMKDIHQAALFLFTEQRDASAAFAAVYRKGNRKEVEAAKKVMAERIYTAYKRLRQVTNAQAEREKSAKKAID